jgi:hypothetical protein
MDHHDVDLVGSDVIEQCLQGRTLQGAARNTTVIIAAFDQSPAFMGLALDIGLGGLALRVEGVEILLQSVFGRLLV